MIFNSKSTNLLAIIKFHYIRKKRSLFEDFVPVYIRHTFIILKLIFDLRLDLFIKSLEVIT